jgi:hypothetical protein
VGRRFRLPWAKISPLSTSFDAVRKIGSELPHVTEATAYGKPALKVRGQIFVCISSHKSAEPDSLVVRVDLEQRAELLATDSEVYYITDHYQDYPAVLVRLKRVRPDVLRDIVGMAYRFVTARRRPVKGA